MADDRKQLEAMEEFKCFLGLYVREVRDQLTASGMSNRDADTAIAMVLRSTVSQVEGSDRPDANVCDPGGHPVVDQERERIAQYGRYRQRLNQVGAAVVVEPVGPSMDALLEALYGKPVTSRLAGGEAPDRFASDTNAFLCRYEILSEDLRLFFACVGYALCRRAHGQGHRAEGHWSAELNCEPPWGEVSKA